MVRALMPPLLELFSSNLLLYPFYFFDLVGAISNTAIMAKHLCRIFPFQKLLTYSSSITSVSAILSPILCVSEEA
jgi:hypothetical protein